MRSLQTRLLLSFAALSIAAVTGVSFAVREATHEEFRLFQKLEERSASAAVPGLAGSIARQLDGSCCAGASLQEAASRAGGRAVIVVTSADGALLASAGEPIATATGMTISRAPGGLEIDVTRTSGDSVERLRLALQVEGAPFRLADGRPALLYVVPFPPAEQQEHAARFLGSIDRRLAAAAVVVTAVALVAAWWLARGISAPLRELADAAGDIARGRLGRRVAPGGGTETVVLGRAFNAMAADLERQQALRRSLIHDVAHELRTPLTAFQCRLETVLDGLASDPAHTLNELREEVVHLGRLVTDLQDVALAEARELALDEDDVDVGAVVASAVRGAGLDGDARLRLQTEDAVIARGDAGRIRQIVLNLLTNAGRYTPRNGAITVRTAAAGDHVRMEVRNTGSRLNDEEIVRVFERFYRTDPSRQRDTGGTGLGLAIVKHLVEAQGGMVWASSDENGVSLTFTLPRAASGHAVRPSYDAGFGEPDYLTVAGNDR